MHVHTGAHAPGRSCTLDLKAGVQLIVAPGNANGGVRGGPRCVCGLQLQASLRTSLSLSPGGPAAAPALAAEVKTCALRWGAVALEGRRVQLHVAHRVGLLPVRQS